MTPMTTWRRSTVIVGLACLGCGTGPEPGSVPTAGAAGPRLALDETIVGRTLAGDTVWVLTDAPQLLTVDLTRAHVASRRLPPLEAGGDQWGLGRTVDGGLWTLVGFDTLTALEDDDDGDNDDGEAESGSMLPLAGRWVGLFGHAWGLVGQEAVLAPGAPLLALLHPRTGASSPLRGLDLIPAATRAETLAANLVYCGTSRTSALPCWRIHDRSITFIEPGHPGRRLEVSRLEGPGVDAGVDGRWEAGPLLDAHVDHAGQLWVLERTAVTDDTGPRTVVTRFPPAGRLSETMAVNRTTRLILGVSGGRCLLLAGTGEILEVEFP